MLLPSFRFPMGLDKQLEAGAVEVAARRSTPSTREPFKPQANSCHRVTTTNYYVKISLICAIVALALASVTRHSMLAGVEAADATKVGQQETQTTNHTASAETKTTTTNTNRPAGLKDDSGAKQARDSKAAGTKTGGGSPLPALESQATDLSSMYVQIPIAEPVDTGADSSDQQQQQRTQQEAAGQESDSAADTAKATTWTGPWPKKFQIGYIKQSDLHQVLIESLKNDPFMGSKAAPGSAANTKSVATKSAPATTQPPVVAGAKGASGPAAPPSDAASLMAPAYPQLKAVQQTLENQDRLLQQQQRIIPPPHHHHHHQQQQQQQYWPNVQPYGRLAMPQVAMPRPKANMYTGQASSHQQQQSFDHQQANRMGRHQLLQQVGGHRGQLHNMRLMPNGYPQNVHFGQQSRAPTSNTQARFPQHQTKLPAPSSSFMQQQQFQFAGFPSNSLKNQPIYTINNFPMQPQPQPQQAIETDQVQQMIQMAGVGGGQQQVGYGPAAGHLNMMGRPQSQAQAQKTSEYFSSSWRPVTSQDEEAKSAGQPQQQINSNDVNMNDGFDDTFSMPMGAKDSQAAGASADSMNRHPALSNFLGQQQNSSSKVSPMKMLKQQQQQGTKSKTSAREESTKSGSSGREQAPLDDSSTKSGTGRRAIASAQNATTSTTQSSSSADSVTASTAQTGRDGADPTTTVSSATTVSATSETNAATTTTTVSPGVANNSSQTTMTTTTTTTTTQSSAQEEATTEPDSEVIDSEATTEPSEQEVATSTVTSIHSLGRSSTTASGVGAGSSTDSAGEAEVLATQAPSTQATFPAVQSEEAVSSAAGGGGGESTTSGAREETTPSSLNAPTGSTSSQGASSSTTPTSAASEGASEASVKGGEVEGAGGNGTQSASLRNGRTDASLSDEALLAAAVRASDVTKSSSASGGAKTSSSKQRSLAGQQQQQVSAKKARSSNSQAQNSGERLVQASQHRQQTLEPSAPGKGGAHTTNSSNKLITRRPQAAAAATASSRAAKQIGASTKSANSKTNSASRSASQKKGPAASAAKLAKASARSQKSTRMAAAAAAPQQAEKLQAAQVISMTAAQAQSTAQTLASLLLSRCLSSANCAHLLDVCSTKQAAVPIGLQAPEVAQSGNSSSSSAGWSMPVGLMSSNLMSLMQALQADRALRLFPAWRDSIENIVDQDTQTGYTLLMPSNDAIERMSAAQIDSLLANGEQMSQLIDNHILDSAETIEIGGTTTATAAATASSNQTSALAERRTPSASRYLRSKRIQVNQHRDRMLTLNGKRLVYANQPAPAGGRIHVIDGLLDWPSATSGASSTGRLLDIMDTLKQCDKFDGFVTLAEGTGLAQILKQDEPLTVFVPSNEALKKIPDEELEVIKNNSTALKEFIMYHIVNGSYFSQDLRDGQQLASILDMRPIQVGVRVDGCSRRLVEANTSPMRRPDIVAKNGVIHILDWYLTTRDNEWCDPIGRLATSAAPRDSSERLQQLASEPAPHASSSSAVVGSSGQQQHPLATVPTYATRMSALPPNHKASVQQQQQQQQQQPADELQPLASDIRPTGASKVSSDQLNSVYVSAVPVNELLQMP